MKVGIIGCGNIAQVHGWSLAKVKDVHMAAFADCNLVKAQEMSAKYTGKKAAAFKDYSVMLEQVMPDVVHICTPHYLHVPMAIEALKRGISVFMEKPPAISREEFEELKKAAVNSKGRIGFCFQNRYNETTQELDNIVEEKKLGEVLGARGIVTWRRDADYYSDDWHGSLEKEGGGVLINQSIHTLDLILRYMGKPVKIGASMQNHHLQGVIEVEDTLEAWMEFPKGKRACLYTTTAYAIDAPVILELAFEKGRVTVIDGMISINQYDGKNQNTYFTMGREGVGKAYWGNGHLTCIEDFYDCLKNGVAYGNDLDGVSNTLETTMKIYEAARKNNRNCEGTEQLQIINKRR